MVDYGINGDFDIYFSDFRDFVEVDGRAEFEDDVVTRLHDEFRDVIGRRGIDDTIEQKIELAVTRVARDFDIIDSISRINIFRVDFEPDTIGVEITYNTGDTFEETI